MDKKLKWCLPLRTCLKLQHLKSLEENHWNNCQDSLLFPWMIWGVWIRSRSPAEQKWEMRPKFFGALQGDAGLWARRSGLRKWKERNGYKVVLPRHLPTCCLLAIAQSSSSRGKSGFAGLQELRDGSSEGSGPVWCESFPQKSPSDAKESLEKTSCQGRGKKGSVIS